ncbi:MAG: multidrug effflux MFS transporter [Pseudomonadota bacterium]
MSGTPLSTREFIALMAVIVATVAFSIDAMLPALGAIAEELTPDAPNRAQLIVPIFVLGIGIGMVFVGPLADAFGRKPVLLVGAVVYIGASLVAWQAPTLEGVLLARFVQGMATAVPRIVAMAVIRDVYRGREMAQILSFVLMVFTLIPVLAPSLGAVLIAGFGWRSLFPAFAIFSALSVAWFAFRQPETLAPTDRRPLRPRAILQGIGEVLSYSVVRRSVAAQCLAFGCLFTLLTTTQPVFDQTFGREAGFPLWFGAVSLVSAGAAYVNSRLVTKVGMRLLIFRSMAALTGFGFVYAGLVQFDLLGPLAFPAYIAFMIAVFSTVAFTIGNLNALAMDPLGQLAGTGASVIGAISTAVSALLGIGAGLLFDGTPFIPAALTAIFASGVLIVMPRPETALHPG